MNRTAVAPREAEVVDAITTRDLIVFGPAEVQRFLDVSQRNAYRILRGMTEKGIVERLARGIYVLSETYERRTSYEIASNLEPASYVGFWSALHFHGLTEQVPRKIFVAVTRQKRSVRIQGQTVQFVRVQPETFFGYRSYGGAVVSDREKTLLDCCRLPEYAGGLALVAKSIPSDVDSDRLVRYAKRLDSGAVAARIGYLLDQKGLLSEPERLQALVSSYTKLDPAGERENPVAEWKLYANVRLDD